MQTNNYRRWVLMVLGVVFSYSLSAQTEGATATNSIPTEWTLESCIGHALNRPNVLAIPTHALRFTPNPFFVGEKAVINDVEAPHKVWTRQGNTYTAHAVELGISGGNYTEVLSGINEGTEIITEASFAHAGGMPDAAPEAAASGERSPFMPGPPGKKK